jgi:uncharacterized protein (TIGR04255 family)
LCTYAKAPITEAVIELRCKEPVEPAAIEKVAKLFLKEYPFDEPQQQLDIRVEPTGARLETRYLGKRLGSVDRTDILVFGSENFVSSRLAPYTGWEDFFARTKAGWDAWRDQIGNRELSRIGVRFINRIDIPILKGEIIEEEKYLNLRDGEEYLSATWMEFFPGTKSICVQAAVQAIRASNMTVSPKSGVAIGNVTAIKTTCAADKNGHKIRIIHEREDDNPAHTALRGWPRENDDLLNLIANDTWNETI